MTETLSDRLRICIASGDGLTKGTSELLREAADELDRRAPDLAEAPVDAQHIITQLMSLHERSRVDETVFKRAAELLASLSRPSVMAVPDGWKLVPIEPTDEMLHACQVAMKNFIRSLTKEERKARGFPEVCGKHGYRIKPYEKAAIRYRAMLSASPASPSPDIGEGK